MSEIERAIQEFEDNAYHPSLKPEISEESKAVALRVLRAELDRERNEPLTCDGCEYDTTGDPDFEYARCGNCSRQNRTWVHDRYEPKGEQP